MPDLEKAWKELFAKALYHVPGTVEVETESKDRKRGRPRKGDEGEFLFFAQKGKACKDIESIRKRELEGACFVIATNDLRPGTSSEDILRYYMKGQQGVERAFRFLKDPLYFADAFFLKNPARIAALLCVMTIALLLFSLAQRKIRLELLAKGLSVETQKKNKKTQKPTMRWVSQHFEGVDVSRVRLGGKVSHHFHRIGEFEKTVLTALGESYVTRYSEVFIG